MKKITIIPARGVGKRIPNGFSYNFGNNTDLETIDSLWKLIKIHIDPNFKA